MKWRSADCHRFGWLVVVDLVLAFRALEIFATRLADFLYQIRVVTDRARLFDRLVP